MEYVRQVKNTLKLMSPERKHELNDAQYKSKTPKARKTFQYSQLKVRQRKLNKIYNMCTVYIGTRIFVGLEE